MENNILTDLKVRKSQIKEKQYQLRDGRGLYLLVKKNGSKLWQQSFTSPITKRRNILSLGRYPDVSLSEARQKRDEYKKQIARGIDPIEHKRVSSQKVLKDTKGMCVNLIDEWLEKEAKDTKPTTQKSKARLFNKDILPYIKNKHIKDVTIDDVLEIIKNKQDTAPEMASRIYGYMDNIFRYAVLKKYCERNILADIRKKDVVKPRVAKHMAKIVDKDILKELVQTIYSYHGNHNVRNALKLVLHVPLRAENLCHLKWEYIDFEKKTLTIPRENMKLNNINLDDFTLPLTDEVISILKDQYSMQHYQSNEKGYIFLGKDKNMPINKESPNKALYRLRFNDEKKGNKIRLHGFRGTFRSLIDTLDVDGKFLFETKEKVLDHHNSNKAVLAYTNKANHQVQMREVMNFWSDFICNLMES